MLFNEIIELGTPSESVVNGEPIKSYTWRKVYADKQSVKRKEFYEGKIQDLKPENVFVIRTCEYAQEEQVKHNGKVYQVIRDYIKGDLTELTVTSLTGS